MSLKTEEMLTTEEVCRLMKFSKITLWRHVRAGKFPQPVRAGRQILRWRESSIEAYLEAQGNMAAIKKSRAKR